MSDVFSIPRFNKRGNSDAVYVRPADLFSVFQILQKKGHGLIACLGHSVEVAKAHFTGTPPLLEGLEVEARLARHRTAPADRSVRVRLRTSQSQAA